MRERDNKGRLMKNGSEKAEKKSEKEGRRSDIPSLKWLKKKGFLSFFALTKNNRLMNSLNTYYTEKTFKKLLSTLYYMNSKNKYSYKIDPDKK